MDCQSFEPIFTEKSRVLILGSMPGIASLTALQYYAHPRNAFWPILFEYFGEPVSKVYSDRCELIRRHELALWDNCRTCRREGSLDTAIHDVKYNDFERIFSICRITCVLCNGQKAYSLFRHSGSAKGREVYCLPSTSPAYTMPYEEKRRIWHEQLDLTFQIKGTK